MGSDRVSKIYAHRGASAELPENTLTAFARAVELGADGIELDVHLSKDGVAVVIHDETLDRTTNGSGNVADLTLAELQSLDAGNGAPIPTLAQVLELASGKLHVDIEVKAALAADAVLEETARHENLEFAISSFIHDVLRHVRSVDETVELWPLTPVMSDVVIETALALGAPQIAIYEKFLNAEIVSYARSRGLDCWVWTVNDPDEAEAFAAMGVVGICTDDPAALLGRFGR
jgi:glycerophosphoryl diester phosphodiesterase